MAVFYGTSDLHPARDANTFTLQLHKVWRQKGRQIPTLEIVRYMKKMISLKNNYTVLGMSTKVGTISTFFIRFVNMRLLNVETIGSPTCGQILNPQVNLIRPLQTLVSQRKCLWIRITQMVK